MAVSLSSSRLALRGGTQDQRPHGAWWPSDRVLSAQLKSFFDLWPASQGRISRVLYSPLDWDDHPRSVPVTGRVVKTGSFPRDDTHELTLTMQDGRRLFVTVIPPATAPSKAARLLNKMASAEPGYRSGAARIGQRNAWEDEGGSLR